MEAQTNIIVRRATEADIHYAEQISEEMASSAKARGTGIAFRTPQYLQQKMVEGKAVIAHAGDGTWAGYCYIEAWSHGKFVANSGLIVSPNFRGQNIATRIKNEIFNLSRAIYPDAKIFGLTTGLAVMKINSELGYEPVTYSELTDDEQFWAGCRSCINFDILTAKERKNCLCTAMLFDPAEQKTTTIPKSISSLPKDKPNGKRKGFARKKNRSFKENILLFERWLRYKKHVLLKRNNQPNSNKTLLSFFH